MARALDATQGDARVEIDADLDPRRVVGMDVVVRGRGRRVVIAGQRVVDARNFRRQGLLGRIARRVGQRQAQREAIVAILDRLPPAHLDLDRLARTDIRHRRAKQAGAVRLDQGRALAAGRGFDVFGAGLFLLADLADDHALADAQGHVVHGRAVGQRQQVLDLDPVVARVAEALADAGFGDEPADSVVDIAGQRNEFERLAVPGRCLDRAESGFRACAGGEAEQQDEQGEDRAQRLEAAFEVGVSFAMVRFHRTLR